MLAELLQASRRVRHIEWKKERNETRLEFIEGGNDDLDAEDVNSRE